MKKSIFTFAILAVFLLIIMSTNQPGNQTIISNNTLTVPQIIDEKTIIEILEYGHFERSTYDNFVQANEVVISKTQKKSELKLEYKAKKLNKPKIDNSDKYADALDKKIERDIKEISALYPEENQQGNKDEFDDEMIGLLNGSEEIADNGYLNLDEFE